MQKPFEDATFALKVRQGLSEVTSESKRHTLGRRGPYAAPASVYLATAEPIWIKE